MKAPHLKGEMWGTRIRGGLVTGGFAEVAALILAAGDDAGLGVDRDELGVAPLA